jgi:hypothetical protein
MRKEILLPEHTEEHCGTDKCPRCRAVYQVLQRYKIQQTPPRYTELYQLAEHAVELETAAINKNMDAFKGIAGTITKQVVHEDKLHDVLGRGCAAKPAAGKETSRPAENKVVVHWRRSEDDILYQKRVLAGLAVPPDFCDVQEEKEIQVTVHERPPEDGLPGTVSIDINTTGMPVQFVRNTDSGNHKSTLRHAKDLLEALGVKNE